MPESVQTPQRRTFNGDWIDRWVVVAIGKGGLVRVIGTPSGNPFATSEAAGRTADSMSNEWERVEVVPFTAEP